LGRSLYPRRHGAKTQWGARFFGSPSLSLSLAAQMFACKALVRTSLLSTAASPGRIVRSRRGWPPSTSSSPRPCAAVRCSESHERGSFPYSSSPAVAADCAEEVSSEYTVEELLVRGDRVRRMMKMERRSDGEREAEAGGRWFPYLDVYRSETGSLTSGEVVEAIGPYILDSRKERMKKVAEGRSYSICLVVEGLTDFGNVSAAFRSADALGIQSVHVISKDKSKRYRDNRHVSMGAEKWLDIELWKSPTECFRALKSRGYRIAATHLGTDTVSIHDMDWSHPTAIVIGNEHRQSEVVDFRGISGDALEASDLHCSIPMNGMVDSFNVSVAAGILMHHAVCDRMSRLGCHGDLTSRERDILLAEFFLRHRETSVGIVEEYARQKVNKTISKL
ncbi:hypothetical protein Taro_006464, partial [Colocasia esculenta]|nr:hypothetical protein [Colocasia esculenta]